MLELYFENLHFKMMFATAMEPQYKSNFKTCLET